jgi:NAD(P)-dependent dehydrogenase (short-subunit alcohol dehydrogenase family)
LSRFDGRVALVTGAGSGIGFEIAQQLLSEGAIVYAADLNPAGAPDGAIKQTLNVSDEEQFAGVIAQIISEQGRLDVLCNNAGIGSTTSPLDCTVEEWDRVFSVNGRGTFIGIKHALPHMLSQGYGSIVNTASVAGMIGLKDRTAYCASKGAVIALTKQVAVQYANTGVRVNCVCPGTVDSPWVGRLTGDTEDPAATRAALIARQPMGRLGKPSEIATAILYLASDDAAFITGTELVIDGGIVAG